MAKRRRLEAPTTPIETKSIGRATPPPIAQVAGEASAISAAQDLIGEIEKARDEGRLIISVPLEEIAVDHLVRDRMSADDEDMAALKASLATHGQRTPIEVVQVAPEGRKGERPEAHTEGRPGYGLISGWRRLAALTALHRETDEARFAKIKALIRTPQDAGEAYVTMVEENEIRVGLSYYERARIAVLAAERGAFPSAEAAVDTLYASGSRAKRSKIRSFMTVHEALGDHLAFPAHIPERLGLQIAAALKDGKAALLKKALARPASSPEAEARALVHAMAPPPRARQIEKIATDLSLEIKGEGASRQVILKGAGVTDDLVQRMKQLIDTKAFGDK